MRALKSSVIDCEWGPDPRVKGDPQTRALTLYPKLTEDRLFLVARRISSLYRGSYRIASVVGGLSATIPPQYAKSPSGGAWRYPSVYHLQTEHLAVIHSQWHGIGAMLLTMPPARLLNALYHRVCHLVPRLAIFGFALILLLYCGLRVYTGYMAHRAFTLLDEVSRIQVGSTEDSVLPLVASYGGLKRFPLPPTPTDDCADKAYCAYLNARIPDYTYDVEISPFHVFAGLNRDLKGLHRLLALLMFRTSDSWRDPLSLRAWLVNVNIPIKAGRVERVQGGIYVEGRTHWLGRTRWLANTWNLSADMPPEWQSKAYAVDGFTLTMTNSGGAGTQNYLTPAATSEQFQAARSFNTRCITSLVPCSCLADLTPHAFEYISRHPEVGSTVITEGCPSAPSR
jgi:hypothetical protein